MKLVVTEKQKMAELIAKSIGQCRHKPLGSPQGRRRLVAYEAGDYIVVPLRGHVMNYSTRKELEKWTHASVDAILSDPKSVVKIPQAGYSQILRNLALASSEVIVATDSDEEGENIGLEILDMLKGVSKPIRRLWLTTTVPSDIRESLSRLRNFNYDLALSVEARRKLDAIVGFAGTRELTLTLKQKVGVSRGVLSFGRVQTSTLWLVVKREWEILNFVPRPYWEITARIKNTLFVHQESPFFDKAAAEEKFARVKNNRAFLCSQVIEETVTTQPPKPMNTSELLKVGSSFLHVSPSKVLSLAEELYLASIISYPRVDNQTYSESFDHKTRLQNLSSGNRYAGYSDKLLSRNLIAPTAGRFAEDHDPVTPVASIMEYEKNALAYKLYELVLRHYLSIFGPTGRFLKTDVRGLINQEPFRAEGTRLVERGFYEVFYRPGKENPIDRFVSSTRYLVEEVNIVEKKTEPLPRFSYTTLLTEMEKENIGTKSTRPSMIQTLQDRQYLKVQRGTILPTEIGTKFLNSIETPWANYISPIFTSRVQKEMEKIAEGKKNWEELVNSERETFLTAVFVFRRWKAESHC